MPLLRELRGAITAFALVVCGFLLLVSLDFGIPGQPLLQSLRFHIAAVLLGLMVLLFFVGAWWRGLLFLVVFALSAGQGGLIIYRQQEHRAAILRDAPRPLLTMLSFNLLQGNGENGQRIAEYIVKSGADVVLVMEAGPVKPYADLLARTYPYRSECPAGAVCDTFLLSRTPLTDVAVRSMSDVWRNRLVLAKTEIDGVTVNLVGAHMVKPYFDDFAEEEAWRLGSVIRSLDGPVVLAGDFNAAPWSGNIDRMASGQDLIPSPIYPATWPVRAGPVGVPIDSMWTRSPLVITSIRSLDDALGSNHRGLIGEIGVASDLGAADTASN